MQVLLILLIPLIVPSLKPRIFQGRHTIFLSTLQPCSRLHGGGQTWSRKSILGMRRWQRNESGIVLSVLWETKDPTTAKDVGLSARTRCHPDVCLHSGAAQTSKLLHNTKEKQLLQPAQPTHPRDFPFPPSSVQARSL